MIRNLVARLTKRSEQSHDNGRAHELDERSAAIMAERPGKMAKLKPFLRRDMPFTLNDAGVYNHL